MSLAGSPQLPTSTKKRSLMPSTPLRRRLRAHGHALNPVVRIGKDGITPGLIRQLTKILFDHELCKVKLESECPIDRFDAAERIGEEPGANIVQILGGTILVYKRHPQNPRFEGTRAAVPESLAGAAPRPRGRSSTDDQPRRPRRARSARDRS